MAVNGLCQPASLREDVVRRTQTTVAVPNPFMLRPIMATRNPVLPKDLSWLTTRASKTEITTRSEA